MLRWSRRGEILAGLIAIALVPQLDGWFRWVMLGMGLVALSPWPGPAAILRRADRDPAVREWDPERGRARARRAMPVLVAALVAGAAVAGYLAGGWPGAIVMAFVGALISGVGAWVTRRLVS